MYRKPAIAIALTAGLVAAGAIAGTVAFSTSAAADAPSVADSVSAPALTAAAAPAGRVMGWDVDGMGPNAHVHSVQVDKHGVAKSFTIQRANWYLVGSNRVTVAPQDLTYVPSERRLVAR